MFIGHGAPVYALWENPYTPTWIDFMKTVPALNAVLVVSAHWYGPGLAVTANEGLQKTIYDFYGFDKEFYEIKYTPPGSPELCEKV